MPAACACCLRSCPLQSWPRRRQQRGQAALPCGRCPRALLATQVVESLFYMWRATRDPKYREWGWHMFSAIQKHCRVPGGYTGVVNVMQARRHRRLRLACCWLARRRSGRPTSCRQSVTPRLLHARLAPSPCAGSSPAGRRDAELVLRRGERSCSCHVLCRACRVWLLVLLLPSLNHSSPRTPHHLPQTLKYFWLLFSPDSALDLSRWVMNTEAHPLKVGRLFAYDAAAAAA